eukprot:scaffold215451_cov23-Prasinocladus_malaysianus.AAC.1
MWHQSFTVLLERAMAYGKLAGDVAENGNAASAMEDSAFLEQEHALFNAVAECQKRMAETIREVHTIAVVFLSVRRLACMQQYSALYSDTTQLGCKSVATCTPKPEIAISRGCYPDMLYNQYTPWLSAC